MSYHRSRTPRLALAALAVAALATLALASDDAGARTFQGEVVDMHCFMLHPDTAMGPDHAKCAASCIQRGLPAGLLVDGQAYLLLGPGHEAANGLVAEHAGQVITVTGTLIDHHGMKAIQLASVEGAEGSMPSGANGAHHHH